jgi:2-polyprenyl-3-methyl-5-hydroxy-6-metoxy-1,4-benzoquinol methylase
MPQEENSLIETRCAICNVSGSSEVVYKANIMLKEIEIATFSARRMPDRKTNQWVKCRSCGLFRSDPILKIDFSEIYHDSKFEYSSEIDGLSRTYRRLLHIASKNIEPSKSNVLEIGGGNGFALYEAKKLGFIEVTGVEPSQDAINKAPQEIRPRMINGMFSSRLVDEGSQDLVFAMHVFDHVPDPADFLANIWASLAPNGVLLLAVHNVNSFSANILKSASPIIDVEHTYLYDKNTLRLIVAQAGFENVRVSSYANLYSLEYLLQLVPIKRPMKLIKLLRKLGILKIKIWIRLGNIYVLATK